MTTTIYDPEGRPTDTYGPAPTSCFAGLVPAGTCAGLPDGVAHTATGYDAGIAGAAATYWDNASMTGAPNLHATVADANGALNVASWPGGTPDTVLGSTWSGRFTGEVTLGASSNLRVAGSGTATLWVDNVATTSTATVAPGLHRFEVDYAPGASPSIELDRSAAGAGSWSPLGGLRPRYGLATRTTTDDATAASPPKVVTTSYGSAGSWPDPAAGLATSSTVDPAGAALTTATAYEGAVDGLFLRPLSRTLPAGNATTSTYYGPTETRTNPCPGGATANQAGRLKLSAAPAKDGGTTPAWTTEAIYDAAGRVVATRRTADLLWTCMTYDARGRLRTKDVPAITAMGTPARTVTSTYSSALGDPRTSTVSDGSGSGPITTTIDLLGRPTSYTDAWGNLTTSTYDLAGRLTDTVGRDGTRHTDYEAAGRPTAQSLDGILLATPTYGATSGELASVAYNANGSALASIGLDPAGRTSR